MADLGITNHAAAAAALTVACNGWVGPGSEERGALRDLPTPVYRALFRVAAQHGRPEVMQEVLRLSDGEATPDPAEAYAILTEIIDAAARVEYGHCRFEGAARVMLDLTPVDPRRDGSKLLLRAAETCNPRIVKLLLEDGRADPREVLRCFRVPAPAPPVTLWSGCSARRQEMRAALLAAADAR